MLRSIYDRELLLRDPKRNEVLELWEVERFGSDSFGDPDYVSIYGMRPAQWHAKGVRILGRTAVECTRDALADAIGKDIAATIATRPPAAGALVFDAFAGSGNTLYWMMRHLPGVRGMGFEADAGVFRLTHQNIAALALPVDILHTDYRSGLAGVSVAPEEMFIAFIAPPWGNALDRTFGLDLRRTTPPVVDVVDHVLQAFPRNPVLCAIQIVEIIVPASLAEVEARFDWSALRVYELNSPRQNPGILLGTKGWHPGPAHARFNR